MNRRNWIKTVGLAGGSLAGASPFTIFKTEDKDIKAKRVLRIAHITDTHLEEESSEQWMRTCLDHIHNQQDRPDIIIGGGDIINDALGRGKDSIDQQWKLWHRVSKKIELPIYYCIGNHDVWGDDYYLELQMPGKEIPGGFEAFVATAAISKDLGIPGVITNDVHYINRGDFRVQKAMMAIKQGLTIDDPNLFHVNSDEQFFKCRAQLRQTFYELGFHEYVKIKQFEEFCDNTVAVVEKCAGFQPDISPKLPEMKDAEHELMKATIRGLRKKGLWNCEKKYEVDGKMVTYREQVKIELDRFITKGFASYFLITQDLVNYSADQLGMPVGPARGSAGGSLVCYALGIHELDPLKWGLSFNRFLSQSRGGWMLKVTMD